jgi:protoporphyrinogen oxidase
MLPEGVSFMLVGDVASDRIVVVGSGIGGLCAALELSSRGHAVTVVDGSLEVGGLLRSVASNGCAFDLGTHFIIETLDHEVDKRMVEPFVQADSAHVFVESLREAHVLFGRLNNSTGCPDLTVLPRDELRDAQNEYRAVESPDFMASESVTDSVLRRYGTTVYESFYEPAVTKLSGTDPVGLSCEVLATLHIPRVVLFDSETSIQMKRDPRHDARIGFSAISDGSSKVRKFYPRVGGIGAWTAFLRRTAQDRGVIFLLGEAVSAVRFEGSQALGVQLDSGDFVPAGTVVWTVAPEILLRSIGDELRGPAPIWRDVHLYHFFINSELNTDAFWVSNYDPAFHSYRTTLYDNFAPAAGSTCDGRVTVEALSAPGEVPPPAHVIADELWRSGIVSRPGASRLGAQASLSRALPLAVLGSQYARASTVERAAGLAENLVLAGSGRNVHGQVNILRDAYAAVSGI